MTKIRYGYMDKVDFDHELGQAKGGNTVHPSIKDLKEHSNCWEECGIVKVKIEYVSTEIPQNFDKFDE